jgi:formyl-CoA transferase
MVETVDDPGRGTGLRLVRSPIRLDGESLGTRTPPPLLGEHTEEVVGEA